MRTRFLSLLLALLLLVGCGNTVPGDAAASDSSEAADSISGTVSQETGESMERKLAQIQALGQAPDDNYRTWYEIFVYSYCDSNGDGVGDLAGVTQKLDYLQDLGIGGIWLMPIHPSPSYHKYDVLDYCAIDPAYGTMEDFETLVSQCADRNIRLIIDLVVNHTSSQHPWFLEAAQYLSTLAPGQNPDPAVCPYADYYFFQDSEAPGYHLVPGTENWYYEGRFSPEMPDLNLGSTAVRAEIEKVMAFWTEKGVSGFRLDAAKEFYSGQTEKNVEVLNWLQTTARELNPDAYLVAEVWDGFSALTQYYESGITSLFNFAFGDSDGKIIKVLRGAGDPALVSTYAPALQKADTAFRGRNPDYIDAPFLSNHDVGRIAGFAGRDPYKTKLAAAMNLFMGGSAFVYYGEELGMVAGALDHPSYRAPMNWGSDSGTTQPPPGCTLPEEAPFGTLAQQEGDPASVYNYYRQAIAIRNAIPSIPRGIPTVEEALNVGCVSACRKTWGEEQCILLMNIDEVPAQVDLSAYEDWEVSASLSADTNEITREGSTLHLPAYGVAVLIPKA